MSAIRAVRPVARNLLYTQSRTMSASTRLNAEGATGSGSSRAGGAAQGDAFTKREAANENKYVQDQEREKLRALQEKIRKQKEQLSQLEDHVTELTKGGKK